MNLLLGVALEPGIKFIHGWDDGHNAGCILREEDGRFLVFLELDVRYNCGWISQASYLKNRNEITDDLPFIIIQLELAQLEALVSGDRVDGLTVAQHKAQHIIRRIPPGGNIARYQVRHQFVHGTSTTPSRQCDGCRID